MTSSLHKLLKDYRTDDESNAGGFGIGLGIGGAIATPLGDLAFGQGASK